MAGLRLDKLRKTFGAVEIIRGVELEIADGEFVVFVGPSGCGKSTLLRMIAGLEDISGGDLFIGGERCNDMEPRDRGIAMVFQSYALYPHLSVYDNMSFGLTLNRTPKAEIEMRVREAARILKLGQLLDRRPAQLSGGQRQRVAIGRAIVRKPRVFLFDEPLSNLDAALRMDMRMEIARLHKELGATMIYVTHDQVEAMTLADKIVVLEGGKVQQVGAPIELYKKPANRFVAGFIGSPKMNFFDVTVTDVASGMATVESAAVAPVSVAAGGLAVGKRAVLGVRPQALRREAMSDRDGTICGTVSLVERLGAETIVSLDTESGARALAAIPQDEIFETGSAVAFRFDPAQAHLFAA
ncbi:sugar ABC transporter ATP-binding protein [Mesorhizobium sp. L-8-10]|uniref:ABC transporter ATP-binding protein n=1 Tax=unclassified Mesorhizobium TaxID=325217 RepID=UPI001927FC07|nr:MULTISPECIES: sn-glycerol-3-phosphate ABC transporter ATP-binding protein UgpC [unclassified Mesorhizobium]BCH20800.1 sugar ABC transporter ATP-binding protein [Mesorhizobium sp. L-8-3]BCH28628.1 sugar ABC transporter ATP-binding protein [Mesorhizobium sp. L-8-10]